MEKNGKMEKKEMKVTMKIERPTYKALSKVKVDKEHKSLSETIEYLIKK